jgi:uncharacterized repeat protein (TIGR03806 family)
MSWAPVPISEFIPPMHSFLFPAFPWIPVWRGRLLQGGLLLALPVVTEGALTNRWSFSNANGAAAPGAVVMDSVGGQNAVVRGQGGTFSNGVLTLPGNTTGNQTPAAVSAYVDLPNGIISSKTNLTVELWAVPQSFQNFQRLLDFGRVVQAGDGAAGEITGTGTTAPGTTQASDSLTLTLSRGASLNEQRFEGKLNAAANANDPNGLYRLADSNLATTAGTTYHFAMTYQAGAGSLAATGGVLSWYRDGVLIASRDVGFRLNQLEDVNNWLGRSLWSADRGTHAGYNEVRVHDHAMSLTEINLSRTVGINPGTPVAQADSITMRHGSKASIAVLANDTAGASVEIVAPPANGTAVPDALGRILYTQTTGAPASDAFTYRARNAAGSSAAVTVTVTFSNNLRLATPALNVPANPPSNNYDIVETFGGLSFTDPVCLVTPPGETRRLFVCQKGGLLRMIPDVTVATPTASTFLDLPALLGTRNEAVSTTSEQGLLGLAFHPNYATNRYFYVFYSVDKDAATSGSPIFERVSRFTTQAGNPNLADPASEVILIEQQDEANNHNGGDLHFGPLDGYLYISFGDEGNQDDSLANSQRITKDFFSAIARIDVDKKPGNLEPNAHPNPTQSSPVTNAVKRYETAPGSGVFRAAYSIPVDNPFVRTVEGGSWNGSFNGSAITAANLPYVRSEFWAVGLRNPWRMFFDIPPATPAVQELWVGDVGGNVREEINVVTRGGNYGWNFREGVIARPGSGAPPAGFSATGPVYDYVHTGDTSMPSNFRGNSVTGGIVYRGTRFAGLQGAYVFADYASGNVWTLRRNATGPATVERIAGMGNISAFGRDPSNGDVLIANLGSDRIQRLVSGTPGNFPLTLSATGLFADLTDLSPNPGLLPYTVNLPFWSDHAAKRRWFTLPGLTEKITWSAEGPWTFPTGQIWVKHFDLPLVRSNPPQPGDPVTPSRRLETRVLVKNAAGAYGVSYQWNAAGTEATLVPDEGASFDIPLTQNGTAYTQRWNIPSRAECMICHTPQGGHSLSMNTRQFNMDNIIHGYNGNQISTLAQAGYFFNNPAPANTLPRHVRAGETAFPVEARVRSWLDVNCAYCHKAGGTGTPAAWDGRIELALAQTGLINGAASNNGGDPLNKLVVPGDPTHSILLNRTALTNGFTRMPPVGSNELDQASIALLTQWIQQSLPSRQTYETWSASTMPGLTPAERAAGADADGDGRTNQDEYLAGTGPLDAASFPAVSSTLTSGQTQLSLTVPPNRSVQVETSNNLTDWLLWNVPGNHGLPQTGGPVVIQGPVSGARSFFRAKVREN